MEGAGGGFYFFDGVAAELVAEGGAEAGGEVVLVAGFEAGEEGSGDDGDGDGEETVGAGVDAAGWAGADRPDKATPDTTAAATTTAAPAASTGPRARMPGSTGPRGRMRRAGGSGSGPTGSPAVAGSPAGAGSQAVTGSQAGAGSSEPAPAGRSVATAGGSFAGACLPPVPGCRCLTRRSTRPGIVGLGSLTGPMPRGAGDCGGGPAGSPGRWPSAARSSAANRPQLG